ncbi:hypothetical protein PG993_002653 [Apiospora rasikravindrae]|uniref:MOSC domain-containing protein n=1 Tax=Apiospora rasikravindrae TaxID=990691 RepID=A0ABR1TXB2_9PEZI
MPVETARLNKQGLEHDRRFMLLKVREDGSLQNVQVLYFPECTRLFQAIDGDDIVVTHQPPETDDHGAKASGQPSSDTELRVPLKPNTVGLETIDIQLYGAAARAYRMGAEPYDRWFSACLGYDVLLVYIGDGRRQILAHSPRQEAKAERANTAPFTATSSSSWFSSVTSYITGRPQQTGSEGSGDDSEEDDDWLAFNEAAPYLVASQASLRDVSSRLPPGETADMMRFRPNIVVDGDAVTCWDEDYWGELLVSPSSCDGGGGGGDETSKQEDDDIGDRNRKCRLALTANCARCISVNIDYGTGRMAEGESGMVLKKLMRDRRVDAGNKWSPIFGRYAHLLPMPKGDAVTTATGHRDAQTGAVISVGDEVKVTKRNAERTVWRWPKT